MFIYDCHGLPIDYVPSETYPPEVDSAVRDHMMKWIRTLHGQSRRRLGKVGIIQGSTVNLDRMEHE